MRKKPSGIIRILCGTIDFLVLLFPIQFIMMGIFKVSILQADFFFQLLFAVYGALFIEYLGGRTIGKYFGKIKVVDSNNKTKKPDLLYAGLRELSKSIYFIPYIGWGLGFISAIMIIVSKNRKAIHDYIGNTEVIYLWEQVEDIT